MNVCIGQLVEGIAGMKSIEDCMTNLFLRYIFTDLLR
jgi:hypothetical protein